MVLLRRNQTLSIISQSDNLLSQAKVFHKVLLPAPFGQTTLKISHFLTSFKAATLINLIPLAIYTNPDATVKKPVNQHITITQS